MLGIRWDHLIFNMGIPILVRWHLHTDSWKNNIRKFAPCLPKAEAWTNWMDDISVWNRWLSEPMLTQIQCHLATISWHPACYPRRVPCETVDALETLIMHGHYVNGLEAVVWPSDDWSSGTTLIPNLLPTLLSWPAEWCMLVGFIWLRPKQKWFIFCWQHFFNSPFGIKNLCILIKI